MHSSSSKSGFRRTSGAMSSPSSVPLLLAVPPPCAWLCCCAGAAIVEVVADRCQIETILPYRPAENDAVAGMTSKTDHDHRDKLAICISSRLKAEFDLFGLLSPFSRTAQSDPSQPSDDRVFDPNCGQSIGSKPSNTTIPIR
jgi:hypothetical protein